MRNLLLIIGFAVCTLASPSYGEYFATEKVNSAEHYPLAVRELVCQSSKSEEDRDTAPRKLASYFFADPYPNSTHHPVLYSPAGDIVQLEDGSIWRVADEDAPSVCSWLASDAIQISPNYSWWSSYPFRMQNIDTGCCVQVGLKMGPFYDSIFTRWIVSVNHSTQELWLNDGSHWKVSGLDKSIFQKWLRDDPIVVGSNDDWLSYKMPNILINVNLYHPEKADLSFVRAVYCY